MPSYLKEISQIVQVSPKERLRYIVRSRDTSEDILTAAYQTDMAENRFVYFIESIYSRRHHAQINLEYLREIIQKNFAAITSTFAKLQSECIDSYPFISVEKTEEFLKTVCELQVEMPPKINRISRA